MVPEPDLDLSLDVPYRRTPCIAPILYLPFAVFWFGYLLELN